MNFRKGVAAYSLIIGIMMASTWVIFALTDQIPELEASPKEIAFHLAAEFLTAFALIIGGLGLILKCNWGFAINLVALGMLAYTVVASTGYYAQAGDYAFVGVFAILMVLTLVFLVFSVWKRNAMAT